jgi:hypothetical protein
LTKHREDIAQAYISKDLIAACKSIGGNNWEDIRSDVAEKMLLMSVERLDKIVDIKRYMIRCCYHASIDLKRKQSNISFTELPNEIIAPTPATRSKVFEKINSDCNNRKRFYHAWVFLYVLKYGSVRAFSREIGIPYNELGKTYNEYIQYLKEWQKSHI